MRHTSSVLLLALIACTTDGAVVLDKDVVDSDLRATDEPLTDSNAPAITVPHILLIVLDDVGIDQVGTYRTALGLPNDGPPMPALDALAAEGVTFLNAWASPTCSPTRAGLLTGRHSFRTGVGTALGPRDLGLPTAETTFAELLDGIATTALIGKWHLGSTAATGGLATPNAQGFDHFAGLLGGAPQDDVAWTLVEDGVDRGIQSAYALTWKIDHALAWIADQPTTEPWVLTVSLNAAHTPLHAPPDALHTQSLPVAAGTACADNAAICFRAMVQAADTEIGRLLDSIDDDVTVIFVGDNGTSGLWIDAPFSRMHAKGSVYEGGLRVPLIIAGPGVTRRGVVESTLVQSLDLFATILAGTGVTPPDNVDAIDLTPWLTGTTATGRAFLYGEQFDATPDVSDQALRDADHLVVRRAASAGPECYDLSIDPDSTTDLYVPSSPPARCDALLAELDAVRTP